MTDSEAIYNLNHIYGIVSSDIQRSLDLAIKAIEERPKGEWAFDERGYFYCDQCGKYPHDQYATTDFCPKCGADMRKGSEEE